MKNVIDLSPGLNLCNTKCGGEGVHVIHIGILSEQKCANKVHVVDHYQLMRYAFNSVLCV